jgi:hypothetical protein
MGSSPHFRALETAEAMGAGEPGALGFRAAKGIENCRALEELNGSPGPADEDVGAPPERRRGARRSTGHFNARARRCCDHGLHFREQLVNRAAKARDIFHIGVGY